MNNSRFKKIKTLNDIKLEKTRLRYEMKTVEHKLNENLNSVQRIITMNRFVTSVSNGFLFARGVSQQFRNIFSWFKRKRSRDNEDYSEE